MSISVITSNDPGDGSGASYSIGISSTTAGHAIVIGFNMRANSTDRISSITDSAGDIFVLAPNSIVVDSTNNRSVAVWYCANISAGITSLTINQTGTGTVEQCYVELASTLNTFFFDAGAGEDLVIPSSNGTTTGPSITVSGADAIIGFAPGNAATPNSPFSTSPWQDIHKTSHNNWLFGYLNAGGGVQSPTLNWISGGSGNLAWVGMAALSENPASAFPDSGGTNIIMGTIRPRPVSDFIA